MYFTQQITFNIIYSSSTHPSHLEKLKIPKEIYFILRNFGKISKQIFFSKNSETRPYFVKVAKKHTKHRFLLLVFD